MLGPAAGSLVSAIAQPDDKIVVGDSGFLLARFLLDRGTTISLTSSNNPSPVGQSVTFSTTVNGTAPTGTVQFLDGSTSIAGCAPVRLAAGIVDSTASCTTASLAVGAHAINITYAGDAANPPAFSPSLIQVVSQPGTDTAIEFYYAPWNHYFITPLPSEIAALDAGVFPGWQRTGESFAVYPDGTAQTAPTCRFFSGQTFAPKSTHFYTPYRFECGYLQRFQSTVWTYEGNAMFVRPPDIFGNCPIGSRPLYRLYNDGQGGAPNHRYTTNLATRASMIAQGWIPEGAGKIGVIACVPS